MALHSFIRGNPISKKKHKWWRVDTTGEKLTSKLIDTIPCTRCGRPPSPEGHDACIANMPGVRNACCGHGIEYPYVQFEDAEVDKLKGEE